MQKIRFSTIEVPPNDVNLGCTQWLKYCIPTDRTIDFQYIVNGQLQELKGLFRDIGDNLDGIKEKQQVFKDWRHYNSFKKLNAIIQLVKTELSAGSYTKVVLFARHADVIKHLQIALQEFRPLTLYAKSNPIKAERYIQNFNNPRHKCRVFISTVLAAARTSFAIFNETSFAIFVETELNPHDNILALAKIKTEKVYARNFAISGDTVDQRVEELVRKNIWRLTHEDDVQTEPRD